MQWSNARRQPGNWSEYYRNEKKDQHKRGNRPDQWAVHGLVKPDQIVVLGLLSGVAGIMLRIKVFDAKHIIGSGDVREKRCNNQRNADNVEPAALGRCIAGLTKRDTDRPG